MNTHKWLFLFLYLLLLIGLTSCQPQLTLNKQAQNNIQPTIMVTATPTITPTFLPLPVNEAVPTATPTLAVSQLAEKAAQTFFDELMNGNSQGAAAQYSDYSLRISNISRNDAADRLKEQMLNGYQWSDLNVKEIQFFDEKTCLIQVTFQLAIKDGQTGEITKSIHEEWWPIRLEEGEWHYNIDNLIDNKTLVIEQKYTGGLTVKPLDMTRYTDRIIVHLLIQNQSNETMVLGQANEILATFVFDDKSIEAENKQFIIERLRSYTDIELEIKGLYSNYPNELILRQWKNYNTDPWFTFSLIQ